MATSNATADPVTLTVPRTILSQVMSLSPELTDRMHDLLERNTDGNLAPTEQAELELLVRVAEFTQIVSTALGAQDKS